MSNQGPTVVSNIEPIRSERIDTPLHRSCTRKFVTSVFHHHGFDDVHIAIVIHAIAVRHRKLMLLLRAKDLLEVTLLLLWLLLLLMMKKGAAG